MALAAATIGAPSGYKISAQLVQGHTFTLSNRYILNDGKILGKGSFGLVTSAKDSKTDAKIAVKRIRPYANDEWDARHTLREIRLMRLLDPHPNIISLYDVSLWNKKTELYLMMELMDCDLHKVIQSKQSLSENHYKCFIKQLLEGVKTMHALGIFHRDLKPGNILVSRDCQLRITDFGLARYMHNETLIGENEQNPMTEYVVTRWYRAPELLLAPSKPYGAAIDLWSVGCILAELILRKPLFPGKSHAQQVSLVFEVLGYSGPEGEDGKGFGFPLSPEATAFLSKRCAGPGKGLRKCLPGASPAAVELITSLLAVNPSLRPTAVQALEKEYLQGAEVLYKYDDIDALIQQDIISQNKVNAQFFDFERSYYTAGQLVQLIHREVGEFSKDLVQANEDTRVEDDAMVMAETPRAINAERADERANPVPNDSSAGAGARTGKIVQEYAASSEQERVNTAPAAHARSDKMGTGHDDDVGNDMDIDGAMPGMEQDSRSFALKDDLSREILNKDPYLSMPAARSMSASSMAGAEQTSPHRMGSIVRKSNKARALQRGDKPPAANASACASVVSRAAPATAGRGMVITRSVLNNAGLDEKNTTYNAAKIGNNPRSAAVEATRAASNEAVLKMMRGGKAHMRSTNSTTRAACHGQTQTQTQTQAHRLRRRHTEHTSPMAAFFSLCRRLSMA